MVNKYIPEKGDIIFVNLSPTKGHEQSGFRPAVVISNVVFNDFSKMIIICPITSNEKEFPTHHVIMNPKKIKGSVLCEHMRSLDYESREIKFVEKLDEEDLLYVSMLIESITD